MLLESEEEERVGEVGVGWRRWMRGRAGRRGHEEAETSAQSQLYSPPVAHRMC